MNIIFFSILGFLTSTLFPPYFFLPLGFIIFPFISLFIENNYNILNKGKLFIYGFSFGFFFFISLLFWIQSPFFIFDETKNFFLVSILLIIFLSLIFATIFTLFVFYNKFLPIFFIIPIIFIFTEYFISNFFYGFPWINFSLILSSNEYFLYIHKQFGTFVTSYLIIQIFCLPYLLLTKKNIQVELRSLVVFIIFPLILSLLINFSSKENKNIVKNKIDVEIIQLNFKKNTNENNPEKRLKKILNNIISSDSSLVIFGENNYPYLVKKQELKIIQSVLKDDQTVIIGATRKENNKYYNTLFNITTSKISHFDKKILVPFGEFLPFRNLFYFLEKISGPVDFSKGSINRIININKDINYLPAICYEIIFYWSLINKYNTESDFIVNITNDIWFGKLLGPYQHFYITRIRSAEFNKPLIRVSNNGISAILNENGKIKSLIDLNTSGSIKLKMNLNNKKNYYQIHNIFKLYLIFILLFLIIFNFIKSNDPK